MITKPLVSIIIPVYNREKFILEVIECSVKQDYPNIEVVIIDNCSSDSSWNIISSFSSNLITKYQNESNIGPVNNWIKGVEISKGDYVKILFSDDLISTDYVSKTMNLMLSNNKNAFVYSRISVVNDEIGPIRNYGYNQTGIYPSELFIKDSIGQIGKHVPVSPGAAIFKRKNLKILKSIPNNLSINHNSTGAGIDLLIYLLSFNENNTFGYINENLTTFRHHGDGFSVKEDLHTAYLCAQSYYFENYNSKYLSKFNSYLILNLIKHKKLGIISQFYSNPKIKYKISFLFIMKLIIEKFKK